MQTLGPPLQTCRLRTSGSGAQLCVSQPQRFRGIVSEAVNRLLHLSDGAFPGPLMGDSDSEQLK